MSSILTAWTAGRRRMAPTLPALLCLGEMRRGRGSPGLEGPPSQPAPSGDPRAHEAPGEERRCSELRADLSQGSLFQG